MLKYVGTSKFNMITINTIADNIVLPISLCICQIYRPLQNFSFGSTKPLWKKYNYLYNYTCPKNFLLLWSAIIASCLFVVYFLRKNGIQLIHRTLFFLENNIT